MEIIKWWMMSSFLYCLSQMMVYKPMKSEKYSQLSSLLSYVQVGLALSLANPIDFVRIRMQTMQELVLQGTLRHPYQNSIECCKRVLKEEGKVAFWKGNASNLLKFYPTQALNWFAKDLYQKLFSILLRPVKSKSPKNQFIINYLGGALAGFTTRTLLYPLQYSRNLMSSQVGSGGMGIYGCLKETFLTEGLRGIYRGALVSIIGVTLFRSTYFGIFDTFKDQTNGSLERWFVSYIASLAAIFVTYPSDTIRRRLMITSQAQSKYKGFLDCAVKIWQKEGVNGYFRGAPVIFAQGATSATIYFIFDKLIRGVKSQH